jgi:hypothetical protein
MSFVVRVLVGCDGRWFGTDRIVTPRLFSHGADGSLQVACWAALAAADNEYERVASAD